MTRQTVRIPGVPQILGDRTYIVPPLSLKQMRIIAPILNAFIEKEKELGAAQATGEVPPGQLVELMSGVADIAWHAISRNYPEVTAEELDDRIDMGNFKALIQAVMGQSGFALTREITDEEKLEGEAMAGSSQ